MASAISPDRILRELADLWAKTDRDGQAETGSGVLRACVMTLIVLAEQSEDLTDLGETLAALMPEHPARTIVVRVCGSAKGPVAEKVYAQCWMPFGQRRQICCERVEITAPDASLNGLSSLLLPILAPDLPVILWLRCMRLFDAPELRSLAAIANKVVLDSMGLADAQAALPRLAAIAHGDALLGDLSWTQLTRWREMLSRVFENRKYLERLPGITTVRVSFAGERPPVFAYYMGAWVMNALADAGVHAELAWEPRPGATGRGLRVDLEGQDFRVVLERDENRLSIQVGELSNYTNMPQPTDYVLMREELGIMRPDPVYERTLAAAAQLAASK
jgi:glucose-6-phosphate dehydrogenase assembly protein OpcA